MASAKMLALRDWIDADPYARGYAGMSDAQVATDMVVDDVLLAGTRTKWDVFNNLQMSEIVQQWDATAEAQGDDAPGKRARIQSLMALLACNPTEPIPVNSYEQLKLLVRRVFGATSNSSDNVDGLFDGDLMTRADYLGFGKEDEPSMTVRVTKARAL